jgi:hypothetical protein
MLCFSEQTNEGCYASQNILTGLRSIASPVCML